jgi:O-antigen/teichoic acid export membrane protein
MDKEKSSYRQIVKATSIFGGVQVFQILMTIIRSKFIAILLGPAGMGIANLLTSTTSLVSGLTNFGIGTSAVRDVAAANANGNKIKVSIVITVLKRLVWITGILGALVTLVFAPWLSRVTFGNSDFSPAFIWISITLLFNQLSSGQLVVLQGMQQLRLLAKSSVIGSFLGLLINIPLYFIYGIKGIVPAIITTSVLALLVSWYFSRKIVGEKIRVTPLRTLAEGKNMLQMGFVIALNGAVLLGVSYLVRIYISKTGGINDVGLYSAGFAIINSYVGMFFNAMATDFYPRLSAIADNNEECKRTINQQADIAILLIVPILMVFIVFIKWVIVILYSNKFLLIEDMLLWAVLGVLFKAASWPVGFIFVPKGDSRIFIMNELFANSYMLLFNILGYRNFGLEGLGISFFIGYVFYFIQVAIITKIRYKFNFDLSFLKIFSVQVLFMIGCFLAVIRLEQLYAYLIGTALIILSSLYSLKELDKRLGLATIWVSFRNKFIKK